MSIDSKTFYNSNRVDLVSAGYQVFPEGVICLNLDPAFESYIELLGIVQRRKGIWVHESILLYIYINYIILLYSKFDYEYIRKESILLNA